MKTTYLKSALFSCSDIPKILFLICFSELEKLKKQNTFLCHNGEFFFVCLYVLSSLSFYNSLSQDEQIR